MDLSNILREEEIRNNSSSFIRELIDINRASTIVDAMLDTPNRKMEYSDIIFEFQKDKADFFRIKKSRFCEIGLYVSQKYYLNKLEEWHKKENDYKELLIEKNEQIDRLLIQIKTYEKEGMKKKKWQFWR